MERNLMKCNEALAEAAMRAGCKCFFGYPITPQTEISAYLAKKMQANGGKIQYVKYPIDYNIEAIKTLICRAMDIGDICPVCGKPAKHMVIWGMAY